jgi:hypothetical protein
MWTPPPFLLSLPLISCLISASVAIARWGLLMSKRTLLLVDFLVDSVVVTTASVVVVVLVAEVDPVVDRPVAVVAPAVVVVAVDVAAVEVVVFDPWEYIP